jgi:hypothetical protein
VILGYLVCSSLSNLLYYCLSHLTGNDCFLKASGYQKEEIESMTIFSLVKPDKLASFFEIVATALKSERPLNEESLGKAPSDDDKKANSTETDRSWDYTTMTLPCIKFPSMSTRRLPPGLTRPVDPLYITVTLMVDEDPHRQCFHCVFTNCRGTNGALGSITPALLELLFSEPQVEEEAGPGNKRSRKEERASNSLTEDAKPSPQRDMEENDDGDDEDEDDEEDDGDNSDSDQAKSSGQSSVKSSGYSE